VESTGNTIPTMSIPPIRHCGKLRFWRKR